MQFTALSGHNFLLERPISEAKQLFILANWQSILGFDMFHFEYPDKDHHVKDMGLNIRYNVLKERADTIIFHADMYMRDSSGHFMKYPKGDLKIRFNVLAYPHTTELPKDGVKIGAIDTFEIAYADGRDHHVRSTGFDAQNQENMFDLSDDSGQHASAMLSYLTYDI